MVSGCTSQGSHTAPSNCPMERLVMFFQRKILIVVNVWTPTPLTSAPTRQEQITVCASAVAESNNLVQNSLAPNHQRSFPHGNFPCLCYESDARLRKLILQYLQKLPRTERRWSCMHCRVI